MQTDFDIIIMGAGPVGMTTALACARDGFHVALIDRQDPKAGLSAGFDGRASAIAASSYTMFHRLGVAQRLDGHVQPITDMLISDGEAGQPSSPLSLHFCGQELGIENAAPHTESADPAMGYMVENIRLRQALLEQIKVTETVTLFAPYTAVQTTFTTGNVQVISTDEQRLTASVLVAADGRNSVTRRAAGIGIQAWPYAQKALVTTVSHTRLHQGVAHELFLPGGPLALLPLTAQRCNIVWSDRVPAIEAAMALSEAAFTAELSRRIGDVLGDISLRPSAKASPCQRWAYPLSFQMAEHYTAPRLALVGDAAHVIHPIAGQGLNMGLRDAAALADTVFEARRMGLDLGGAALETYATWRRFDNHGLAAATDILDRLFSNRIAPLRHMRRLGLGVIDRLPPLRRAFMQEAAGLSGDLPRLLRS